ncbi:MAG: SDR family oxidoreductase [Rhodobacteraceae bacterium]|nr:SDR family oxidoreductase [Paracoccaceae bacterium]
MSRVSDPAGGNAGAPVLVLGAGSDIARAIAQLLAARGHPLQLAARNPAALDRDAADYATRHGVAVTTHAYDATDLARIEAFLDGLPALPRIVISAVGLMGDQEANAADPARAAEVIATNFTGPALTLEAAARRIAAAGGPGAVIGISSVAGDRGRAKNYVYGAAKAGFTAWLSGLRQKHARGPVLVMTVKPGFVATAMTEGMDLPAALTTTPEALAARIVAALDRGRPVHVDPLWRIVMGVIAHLPERIFMRTRF